MQHREDGTFKPCAMEEVYDRLHPDWEYVGREGNRHRVRCRCGRQSLKRTDRLDTGCRSCVNSRVKTKASQTLVDRHLHTELKQEGEIWKRGVAYWITVSCMRGHTFQRQVVTRKLGNGCPLCLERTQIEEARGFAHPFVEVLGRVKHKSNLSHWLCRCRNCGVEKIRSNADVKKGGCRKCAGIRQRKNLQDPRLACLPSYLKPVATETIRHTTVWLIECQRCQRVSRRGVNRLASQCSCSKPNRQKPDTQEAFLIKASKACFGFYTFEKAKYVRSQECVIVTCPLHGDFKTLPSNLIKRGGGCHGCQKLLGSLHRSLMHAGEPYQSPTNLKEKLCQLRSGLEIKCRTTIDKARKSSSNPKRLRSYKEELKTLSTQLTLLSHLLKTASKKGSPKSNVH